MKNDPRKSAMPMIDQVMVLWAVLSCWSLPPAVSQRYPAASAIIKDAIPANARTSLRMSFTIVVSSQSLGVEMKLIS